MTVRQSNGNIVGTSGADRIDSVGGFTTNGPDSVFGGDGNDTIFGGDSGMGIPLSDFLIGDGGDDQIFGEGGDDALFGRIGFDTMEGGAGTDLMFGEDGDDRLVGGTGLDALLGGAGADMFVLTPEAGNANIEGIFDFSRAQGDRIEFQATAFAGVTTAAQAVAAQTTLSGGVLIDGRMVPTLFTIVNFGTNTAPQVLFLGGNPTLIAGDFVVVGGASPPPPPPPPGTGSTAGADNLIGTAAADLLDGQGGNDTLTGLDGADTLLGGDGNDSILPGTGADLADGGAGDDTIEGASDSTDDILLDGAGDDTLILVDGSSSPLTAVAIEAADLTNSTNVTLAPIFALDLSNGRGAPMGFSDSQSFMNFESDATLDPADRQKPQNIAVDIPVVGTTDNQVARGNGKINSFENFTGQSNTDVSIFAPDIARSLIDISGARSGVVVGFGGADTIIGSQGPDILAGGPGDDVIRGNGGFDLIRGGPGDDIIDGGDGNDIIDGRRGNDFVDGGPGNDLYRVDFVSVSIGALIDASRGPTINGGDGDVDTIVGIERFELSGGRGNDTLIGGMGNDFLRGNGGNDFVDGGPGFDSYKIDVFDGLSTLIDASRPASIVAGLGDVDTVVGVERFEITGGDGNDTLIGSAGSDILSGGPGNDLLTGGPGGLDLLQGGTGADRIVFNSLGDSPIDPGGFGVDFVSDFKQPEGDRFQLPAAVMSTGLFNAGTVVAPNLNAAVNLVYADRCSLIPGAQALGAKQAAFFTFTNRTFLTINDGTAAYAPGGDAVVDVTGIVFKPGDATLPTLIASDYFIAS